MGYDLDGLALGRIATKDFACCRVLDWMLMYERRIDSSVIKLTKELRKQQLMWRIERLQISQDQAIAQTEALMEKKVNLKKQSQFMSDLMGATPFVKGAYDNNMPGGEDENKASYTCPEHIERNRVDAIVSKEGYGSRAKSIPTATD